MIVELATATLLLRWKALLLSALAMLPLAALLAVVLVGTLEFVGPNERQGWRLAGTIVPIAYIAWSIWLAALGVFLVV